VVAVGELSTRRRFTVLFALGVVLIAPARAADAGAAPGERFDLSRYKLQLPQARGDGVVEIAQPALARYTSDFFYFDARSGAMVFHCPDSGAKTRQSHYPRVELRRLDEWTFAGTNRLSATLAVLRQPGSTSIIVAQIHGHSAGSEALKIRWIDGAIIAAAKTSLGAAETRVTLASGVKLGQRFSLRIEQRERVVNIEINGASASFTYDASWNDQAVYFKAGNYLQDNSASGSAGTVAFYTLQ
jgi:Alginate lyase